MFPSPQKPPHSIYDNPVCQFINHTLQFTNVMPTLKTNLKPTRLAAGLSQTSLARQAAISRQAYVSIETGKSVPSTEVSLRLARALGCTVESLFSLPFEEGTTVRAELLPTPHPSPIPSRVQLFSVGGRLLARPLSGRSSTSYTMTPADGITMTSDSPHDVSVRLLAPLDQANTLVLAGGDPAIPFLSRDLALRDFRMVRLGEDSNTALAYLSAGTAHVAGCHLFDETTGQYNVSWVRRLAPFPCSVITFAVREQGLIVAAGNPKNVASIDDLSRPDLSFINREEGSGSRALMDRLISQSGLTPDAINGYHRTAEGHLAVADTVALGLADAGIGVRSAAEARGLDFVPLGQERYDFVIPNHFLDLPMVQAFIETLKQPYSRRQVEALGGYDISSMGDPVTV